MTETTTVTTTETVALDWDLIDRRCSELGAHTGTERAELLGVGRASLYRWRAGGGMRLSHAAQIAGRLDVALSDLLIEPEAGR